MFLLQSTEEKAGAQVVQTGTQCGIFREQVDILLHLQGRKLPVLLRKTFQESGGLFRQAAGF